MINPVFSAKPKQSPTPITVKKIYSAPAKTSASTKFKLVPEEILLLQLKMRIFFPISSSEVHSKFFQRLRKNFCPSKHIYEMLADLVRSTFWSVHFFWMAVITTKTRTFLIICYQPEKRNTRSYRVWLCLSWEKRKEGKKRGTQRMILRKELTENTDY